MEYPEFISLNGTAMRLSNREDVWGNAIGKEYRRFMGCWSIGFSEESGVLRSKSKAFDHLDNKELIPITAQEWWDDDGGDNIDISLIEVPHKYNVGDVIKGQRIIQIFANKFPSQVKNQGKDIVFYNVVPEADFVIYRAHLVGESYLN